MTKINPPGFLQPGFCAHRHDTCQCRLPTGVAQGEDTAKDRWDDCAEAGGKMAEGTHHPSLPQPGPVPLLDRVQGTIAAVWPKCGILGNAIALRLASAGGTRGHKCHPEFGELQ